jgi:hypothetical protein
MAPDHADAQAIQADLAAFVSSLGITATRTDQTYDSLVHAAQEHPAARPPTARSRNLCH